MDQPGPQQLRFGTDGVRGLANVSLTAELAVDLSVAAAHVLGEAGVFSGHRPVAVVGRDTRISGQFLEAAVVAGLASAGVDVLLLGVLPTPGVAYLTDALGADLGVIPIHHWPNHEIALITKFFEYSHARLPIVVSDVRTMAEPRKPRALREERKGTR